jgi:hypothetical protein
MTFNPKGLLVTAAYVHLLVIALRTDSVGTADFVERMVLWSVIVVLTVATIASMIRHYRLEPFGQDAAFREIRGWFSAIFKHS